MKRTRHYEIGEHLVLLCSQKGQEGYAPLIGNFIIDGNVVQDTWMQDAGNRAAQGAALMKLS